METKFLSVTTLKAISVLVIGIVLGGYAFTAMSKKSFNIWKA